MPRDRVPLVAFAAGVLLTAASVGAQPRAEGEGVVVAIEQQGPRVTLDHGPIRGVMPAMRMAFRVGHADLLADLQAGDRVRFTLESRGPEWLIVAVQRIGEPPTPTPVRVPAPDFALRAVDGGSVSLSMHRGKALLVNFWASWCVPCRTEMPALERLYQRHKDGGLEVLAINLDTLSTAGVEDFLKEVKVTFPVLLDPQWSTAQAYRVVGLPTTYLIDRTGHIVVREIGARDWDDLASHAAVTKLLDGRSQP
jgi:peroxiredoxin/Cu/Ag efflux protein CusF